jgi:glycosyltransferase involved in cell wall biosynthesis
MQKIRTVFLSSNEPIPTFTRKMDLLKDCDRFDVHLIHWHRKNSLINMPLHSKIERERVHNIELLEPRGLFIKKIFLYLVFFIHVLRIVRRLKPSLMHTNNMDMLFVACLINALGIKYKLVLDLIDTRQIFIQFPLRMLSRQLLKMTSAIFITSPGYLHHFLEQVDKNIAPKVIFVPNAPREENFRGYIKKTDTNSLHIGYFGFLRGEETISNLVATIKKLNEEGLNVKVIFAGIGICKPQVEKFAEKYEFVKYVGPFSFNEDIKELYGSVDLIFSMYYLDHNKKIHMSCRYSEAVVCNLPIIVQDGSFMANLIRRDGNGYVLKLGQWSKLYKLLKHIYFNRQDLEEKDSNCNKIKQQNLFDTYEKKIIDRFSRLAIRR